MRVLKLVFLVGGAALFAWLIYAANLNEILDQVRLVGAGFLLVLAIYLVAFWIDTFTWHLALLEVPVDSKWEWRLFWVRLAGEAFNAVTPAGGLGGEPVKAVVLKSSYGILLINGAASLILARTINMIALLIFLAGGFILLLGNESVPPAYDGVAAVGLAALTFGVAALFYLQRFKITSLAAGAAAKWRALASIGNILVHIREMEDRLIRFYGGHRARFVLATALAWVNWMLGAAEVYVVMRFLGHPITSAEAWIVEAAAQLVRAGVFFIPAAIGAQDGVFVIMIGAMTGLPGAGLAAALIRRFREIVWIAGGLAAFYFLKPQKPGGGEKARG